MRKEIGPIATPDFLQWAPACPRRARARSCGGSCARSPRTRPTSWATSPPWPIPPWWREPGGPASGALTWRPTARRLRYLGGAPGGAPTTASMREVLIADDHPLFRDALKRAVTQALPEAALFDAESVPGLLALVEAHPEADLLLLDLHMPGARGFSALAHLARPAPGLPSSSCRRTRKPRWRGAPWRMAPRAISPNPVRWRASSPPFARCSTATCGCRRSSPRVRPS